MSVKIRPKDVWTYVFIMAYILPGSIYNISELESLQHGLALCRYLITIYAFAKILSSQGWKKEIISSFMAVSFFTVTLMIISSQMNGTIYLTAMLSSMTLLGFLIVNLHLFSTDYEKTLEIYRNILYIYLGLHLITLLFYRNGIVDGLTGDGRVWFLGSKNKLSLYVILSILVTYLINARNRKWTPIHFILLFILNMEVILNGSSTTLLALLIIDVYLVIGRTTLNINGKGRKIISGVFTGAAFLVIILFFTTVILQGENTSNILNYMTAFVGKDISFSGRTSIWKRAIQYVLANPLWGLGNDVVYDVWGNYHYVYSAHNEVLDFAVKYGCIALVGFVVMHIITISAALRNKNSTTCRMCLVCVASLLFSGMFEAIGAEYSTWMILLLTYYEARQSKAIYKSDRKDRHEHF